MEARLVNGHVPRATGFATNIECFLPLPYAVVKTIELLFLAFKCTRIPGTFYRSLTVTAPYVVDSANGAVTVRER